MLTLALVTVWLVPKGFQATARILGHHDSDVVKHYWNLWWFRQMVLVDGKLPYATHYLNHPNGFLLYPIEPLNGLAVLLLGGPLGLPLATNVLSVLNLTLAGLGMYALVRYLTGRTIPALGAGLFYALSAYALWTVYVGVGELSHLAWLPLACLFLHRAASAGGWKNVLAATGLFFVTAFACWYYALFLYMIAAMLMVTDPWRPGATVRLWVRYAVILLVSLGLILPVQRAFDVSYRSQARSTEGLIEYVQRRIDAQPHDAPPTRLDLKHLLLGGPRVRNLTVQNPYIAGRFTGVSILVLAILAFFRRPRTAARWLLIVLVMATLGLGSRLVFDGTETGPRLPFAYLNLGLEWFSQPINFPARFVMPVTLALAVLGGLGLDALGRFLERLLGSRTGARTIASGLVALLAAVPVLEHRWRGDVPSPLPSRSVAALPAAHFVAQNPEPMAVIEFPQLYEDGRKSRDAILLMQTVHGKKSASLPLDRISTFVMSGRQLVRSNPLIRSLVVLNDMNGPDENMCCQETPPNDPFMVFQRKWLVSRDFRRLIVTYREMKPAAASAVRAYCRHAFGTPLFSDGVQEVYDITPVLPHLETRGGDESTDSKSEGPTTDPAPTSTGTPGDSRPGRSVQHP